MTQSAEKRQLKKQFDIRYQTAFCSLDLFNYSLLLSSLLLLLLLLSLLLLLFSFTSTLLSLLLFPLLLLPSLPQPTKTSITERAIAKNTFFFICHSPFLNFIILKKIYHN